MLSEETIGSFLSADNIPSRKMAASATRVTSLALARRVVFH